MAMSRTLLINADDLGIHEGATDAVIETLDHGLAASVSLMVPCPGAERALRILAERPDLAVGIHLTLIADFPDHPWAPLTGGASLLHRSGQLFPVEGRADLLAQARLDEVEAEFRAQIEAALSAGLRPTHLDWHCLADGGRPDIFAVTLALADEYGLRIRAWLDDSRRAISGRGQPVQDHPFLDSFAIPLQDKEDRLIRRLRDLPPGLSEWAMHPALPNPIDPGSEVRRTDHAFLVSSRAKEIVEEEGITLIGYGE